ncbi:unnamed protein product, partial [Strongylus vulgaris]
MDARGFAIEQLDVTSSYQRCAMGEIAVTTEKDVLLLSSSGSAKEFIKEQAAVEAVLGSIQPKAEQFDSASVKISASKKLELESTMKAAQEETTEGQLTLKKDELSLASTKEIKEKITQQEVRSTKATESVSTEQAVTLSSADQKEVSDVRVTAKNLADACTKVQESSEEQVQGLWRTPSGAEASFTLKEKEKLVEHKLLATKASGQEEVSISEFREFSQEEAALGLVAHSIQAPREQYEEKTTSIRTSSTVRVGESMNAAREEFADQSAVLTKSADSQSLQYVTSQKQEIIGLARLKATEEHQTELAVDKTKQEQTATESKLLVDATKVENALKLQESKDE